MARYPGIERVAHLQIPAEGAAVMSAVNDCPSAETMSTIPKAPGSSRSWCTPGCRGPAARPLASERSMPPSLRQIDGHVHRVGQSSSTATFCWSSRAWIVAVVRADLRDARVERGNATAAAC